MDVVKKRFEAKLRRMTNGKVVNEIYINGELLDWSVDMNSLSQAMVMGPEYAWQAQQSIAKHFTESVSEMLGRKVTMEEINKAIATGWI